MKYLPHEIDELKQVSPNLRIAKEGGYTYFLLESFTLPEGCNPGIVDLLLCPCHKNGYNSILYFSAKPLGSFNLNWNGQVHVLSRNWVSYSWKTPSSLTLLQKLQVHLNALRKK